MGFMIRKYPDASMSELKAVSGEATKSKAMTVCAERYLDSRDATVELRKMYVALNEAHKKSAAEFMRVFDEVNNRLDDYHERYDLF